MPASVSTATTGAGTPREAKLTLSAGVLGSLSAGVFGLPCRLRRTGPELSMGRAVIRFVFGSWVAAFSMAATSVETCSLTERRTTGAPWWLRLTTCSVLLTLLHGPPRRPDRRAAPAQATPATSRTPLETRTSPSRSLARRQGFTDYAKRGP